MEQELFDYNYTILLGCFSKDLLFKYGINQLSQIKNEMINIYLKKYDLIDNEILEGNLFKYIDDETLCYFILNHNCYIFATGFDEYNKNLISFKKWSDEQEINNHQYYHIENLPKYIFWN